MSFLPRWFGRQFALGAATDPAVTRELREVVRDVVEPETIISGETQDKTATWFVKTRAYMHQEVRRHVDPYTNEVNATALAEAAASLFDLYGPEPDYDIPDWVYECARGIADMHEAKLARDDADAHSRRGP